MKPKVFKDPEVQRLWEDYQSAHKRFMDAWDAFSKATGRPLELADTR